MDKYYENLLPIKNYFNKSIECLDIDNNLDKIIKMQEKINAYSIIYEICIQDVDLDKADEGATACYNFYKENMIKYCQEISSRLKKGNILFQLLKYYRKFNKLYLWLNTIFCYIDRHYVKNNDLKNIKKDLANSIFVEEVIENNGTVLCDDYDLSYAPGVRKAIDEFALKHDFKCTIICNDRFAKIEKN